MDSEQVRFTLRLETPFGSNNFQDYVLIDEPFLQDRQEDRPLFWHDIPKTFERVKGKGGFTIRYIESMSFVKRGRQLLKSYFDKYAPNGRAFIIVEISNPYTDVPELEYEGEINIKAKYSDKDEQFKVSIINGGLTELINAQESEKFELDRTTFIDGEFTKPTDINGNEITEIEYKTNSFPGRKLKNQSLLRNEEEINIVETFNNPVSLDAAIVYESDDLIQGVTNIPDVNGRKNFLGFSNSGGVFFNREQLFYVESDRDKLLNITISYKGTIISNQADSGDNKEFTFYLADDFTYNAQFLQYDTSYDRMKVVKRVIRNSGESSTVNFDFSETITVDLKEGGSLGIAVQFPKIIGNGSWSILANKEDFRIFIDEDSVFPSSQSPCLTIKEAYERTSEIITGNRNQFLSDFFTNGYWKDLTISSGKMIRNLPKVNEDREPLDQIESITTSIKELNSISGYLNTGYGIEVHNGVEKFVVEDLRHFYRTKVTIDLGEIYDLEEVPADEFYFNGAKFGNEKAGDYEEQFGLYETNALNEYGFPTTRIKDQYDGTSKLRSDAIPIELLRRKGFEYAPTEDTPYDKENFINDCKIVNGLYTPKLWQDVLQEQPKKVYDPDSAWNFALTPLRSLFRHGWWFRTLLYKFTNDFVKYKSSTGFSGMIMQFPDEPEYAENGDVKINDLDLERFQAKYYDCKVKKTYELKKQLEGTYTENGREIPNIYGLAQFTYKNNVPQYGWIMKSELTREIKLRILKANL